VNNPEQAISIFDKVQVHMSQWQHAELLRLQKTDSLGFLRKVQTGQRSRICQSLTWSVRYDSRTKGEGDLVCHVLAETREEHPHILERLRRMAV
jgi:hypothetical protein